MQLKLASYNIRKSIGTDWVRNSRRIVDVLEELNADIVVLQEVDRRFGSRKGTLSISDLKRRLGYDLVDFSIRNQSQGWHGNALLYRKGFSVAESGRLNLPTFASRGAISALFQNQNGQIRIIGTHLALLGNMRKKQINTLVKYITEDNKNTPTLLAGDFNEWKKEGVAYRAIANSFNVVTPGASFHSSNPILPLDRFVLTDNIEVNDYGVHTSEQAKKASDHLPVFIDVAISKTED